MPDGDYIYVGRTITFLALGDISMYNKCPIAGGLIENFANET